MSILEFAKRYQLQWKDIKFWAPYWINWPGVTKSPLKGKASPSELQSAVNTAFSEDPYPPQEPEVARFQMMRNALGVDCSAFVYHTLADYLKERGITLAQHLYVSREGVLKGAQKASWMKDYKLSDEEVDRLPEQVQLSWVCATYHRKPEHLTSVARLCNLTSSTELLEDSSLQIGDMVYIQGEYGDHMQLVVDFSDDESFTVMSSRFEALGPGGVYEEVVDGNELRGRGSLWRLKCISEEQ